MEMRKGEERRERLGEANVPLIYLNTHYSFRYVKRPQNSKHTKRTRLSNGSFPSGAFHLVWVEWR